MRRRWLASAVILALAIAAGGLLFAHLHRFDGGPLSDPGGPGIGGVMPIGRPFVSAEMAVDNTGGSRITLEDARVGHELPGTSVRVWVVTVGKHVFSEGIAFPPPGLAASDLHQIRGFHIAGHARSVQLIAEITATRPGCGGFEGITIDYTTGFIHYHRTWPSPSFVGGPPGTHCPNHS